MSAQPRTNTIEQELERELARLLQMARAENKPAEVLIAGTRYRLVPVDEGQPAAEDVQAAKRTLRQHFGSVAPHQRPEDFAALREQFERGVAEDAWTRGQR